MKEKTKEKKGNVGVKEAPRPFLQAVARAYANEFDDLSEFCFVFPNKRAGTFFLKYLRDERQTMTLSPEITSITDFVARLADHDVASRIDLLFRLYNIYRAGEEESGEARRSFADFDSFRSWGETLLSDFSEVDQYRVDADALFKNVHDFRNIASNFLTEEQLEVMERYFGYAPGRREVEDFWKNLEPVSETKERFLLLWQQMAPLYHRLNDSLAAERLCTSGGAYRLALENLETKGREILPWKKVVLVGFNALSTTEALIFRNLADLEPEEGIAGAYAEFFWDGTGPVLGKGRSDATAFLWHNERNFRSPVWASEYLAEAETDTLPEIRIIASPSDSVQAKIAGDIAGQWQESLGEEDIKDARAAIVLPDENLLMPLLYALPPTISKVNLTMGYPLRSTSVISFVHQLRKLRSSARISRGETMYYHEDLSLFLSHPYAHVLIGTAEISKIKGYIRHHHCITVSIGTLESLSSMAAYVLRLLPADISTKDTIGYIEDVLEKVSAALDAGEGTGALMKSRIDKSHIDIYLKALGRLRSACAEHGVEMGMQSVFAITDKLLAGEQAPFEGEPLEGLQVMGLLETRALDFEHLVILSMNDRIMPRKASARTFIPDSLRYGYGLPFSNYREELFSYYFYRMISRVRKVTLIYDARAGEGMKTGGMSRYLMQLKYLYAPGEIKWEKAKFRLPATGEGGARSVHKDEKVLAMLEEYSRPDSKKNFSASALKRYLVCQVKFYYEYVLGIRADNPPSEYLDPVMVGNVLHDVMLRIYFPEGRRKIYLENPIELRPEEIDRLIEDREGLDAMIRRSINREHFHLKPEEEDRPLEEAARIIGERIADSIRNILRYDRNLAPFSLEGGEITRLTRYRLPDGRRVNMKYAIDRLDRIGGRYRIVDYKTGASEVKVNSIEQLFSGDESSLNFFQLMLYANMMAADRRIKDGIRLSIYQVTDLAGSGEVIPRINVSPPGKTASYRQVEDHLQENEEFLARLDTTLTEIFDPSRDFLPADNDKACRYCNLAHLCGRK